MENRRGSESAEIANMIGRIHPKVVGIPPDLSSTGKNWPKQLQDSLNFSMWVEITPGLACVSPESAEFGSKFEVCAQFEMCAEF